jgi:DegV family protein with EDD domain
VFDYLYDNGDIIYQKVEDMQQQEAVLKHRKHDIALVTDSIADLPQELIDEYQIHVVHLDILFKNMIYMDKLTIRPERLLQTSKSELELPTSSQPNPKNIENLLDYLSTYYQSIIIMTVSKDLSGTYNVFYNAAKNFKNKDTKISVINTKQNSGAQGLLVKKCAEFIQEGLSHDEIVKRIEVNLSASKILVQVRTIDNMIKSGRLSVRAGKLAKSVGLKPIITLDSDGKGALESIAFSISGSNKKIIKHINKIIQTHEIEQYNIVHVNNEAGAKELARFMTPIIGFEPAYITETSSIVAVSAGEGAVALSYLRK